MFAKREDWQGLERSELLKYFNDCGHFPTQKQIDELWDLFHRCEYRALILVPPSLFSPCFSSSSSLIYCLVMYIHCTLRFIK